jgi:hypothetical protein
VKGKKEKETKERKKERREEKKHKKETSLNKKPAKSVRLTIWGKERKKERKKEKRLTSGRTMRISKKEKRRTPRREIEANKKHKASKQNTNQGSFQLSSPSTIANQKSQRERSQLVIRGVGLGLLLLFLDQTFLFN